MELLVIGILFAIGFIWPIHKLNINLRRKLNGYAFAVDVIVGALMSWLFFGTQGGMVIATIATVLFTAYMTWSARTIGSMRFTIRGWKHTST